MLIPWETGLSRSHYQYWISEERSRMGQHFFSARPCAGYLLHLMFKALLLVYLLKKYKLEKLFSLVDGS